MIMMIIDARIDELHVTRLIASEQISNNCQMDRN